MLGINFASPLRLPAALALAGCLAAGARAQSPAASAASPSSPGASAASRPAASKADAEFLSKASRLYYSSAKAGLRSFDCAVHPEWRTLILSAQPGAAVADDDPRIVLLKTVSITLHGRLSGGSTLDWNAPAPAKDVDSDNAGLLDPMHKAAERTLTGFMQFWSPFVDGSVIPSSTDGLEITHTDKGHTLHADQGGTSLTEILGNDMIMQQFNVVMGDARINFSPRYKPTDEGLLVNAFLAHIQAPSTPPDQAEEMHVEIDYQTIGGFPIPSRINMDVTGQGKFNFALDGCTVNSK